MYQRKGKTRSLLN